MNNRALVHVANANAFIVRLWLVLLNPEKHWHTFACSKLLTRLTEGWTKSGFKLA